MCRGKPPPSFELVAPAIPAFARALQASQDDEVSADASWALSYLSDGSNDHIEAVLASGVAPRLVALLSHPNASVVTPALRAVGNVVTGDDRQTAAMLREGLLAQLAPLLSHPKKSIRKETCWALSNITAGSPDQVQAVIDAGFFPALFTIIATCADYDVRKEAAWTVANATSPKIPSQVEYLVRSGCLPPLVALLSVPDNKVLLVVLEAFENILAVGAQAADLQGGDNAMAAAVQAAGAVPLVESLQHNDNHGVYEKAVKILEKYFEASSEAEGVNNNPAQA
jgi:hypothetical protein